MFVTALVANEKQEIFELDGYAAVGMSGDNFIPLTKENTLKMPYGSEIMLLSDRIPVFFNIAKKKIESLSQNPFDPYSRIFPVATFNSPGYLATYIAGYKESKNAKILPLFSYGALGWSDDDFAVAAIHIDKERRQDLRLMPMEKVNSGVREMRKKMPHNRLLKHLEKCALIYGCPAGKNFFLKRFEAPLPTSTHCNAACLGCISYQPREGSIISCQERIDFIPSPDEIAEIALTHIGNTDNAIVSFGQGCEGDPIFSGDTICDAVKKIRSETSEGTINVNTNASKPDIIERMIEAGIDSIRVSINSVRKKCYHAYFRPKGYKFEDVIESIKLASSNKIFVSINYLNCPGFTDTKQEAEAFIEFLRKNTINRIQWRNLNYDPLGYILAMNKAEKSDSPIGMDNHLKYIANNFPDIEFGYFNPSLQKL